jgi:hypothetical protein
MGLYVVHLIQAAYRQRPDKPPLKVLYNGDDRAAALDAVTAAHERPENTGLYVRFYDFHMFCGGMKDTAIT